MSKNKNPWISCLLDIVKASLAALVVYFGSVLFLAAMFEKSKTLRFLAAYVFLMAAYAIFFYRFHAHDRLDTYAEHTDKFNIKKELLAYIRSDDKCLFIIYVVSAVVTDISGIVTQYAPTNPFGVSMFFLGPWLYLHIPALCAIIGSVYSIAVACIVAIIRSRKIYLKENGLLKKRKE